MDVVALKLKIAEKIRIRNEAEILMDPLYAEIADLKNKLAANCDLSSCQNRKDGVDYYPGSYLDKSETIYYVHCEVCGQRKDARRDVGGYG